MSSTLSAASCSFLLSDFILRANFLLRFASALRALPRPLASGPIASIQLMSWMVGGPPTSTSGPAGIGSTELIGSISDLAAFFFLGRGGAGMPMSWQLSTGRPAKLIGSPSACTVLLPMNISDSFVGGLANGPPMGMCGGSAWPDVPATARGKPLTFTVAPTIGT